ncbi:pathogenesis-related protein 1A1 [Biomphalaria glabrata]|nr:pathogenesis-related protein 1A1 [Biomphalaria glabrata]
MSVIILLLTILLFSMTFSDSVMVNKVSRDKFLELHNAERRRVGTQPLVWNMTLARSSAAYAAKCIWEHSKGKYGENLYRSRPRQNDTVKLAENSVKSWLKEKPGKLGPDWPCLKDLQCGHYTQIVWNTTKTVGCAVAYCRGTNPNLVVCQYFPAGNIIGRKPF